MLPLISRAFGLIVAFVVPAALTLASEPAESAASAGGPSESRFATVNSTELSLERYVQALQGTARTTFYHGRPPEGDYEKFRYDVGQDLIETELLVQEAKRRGIAPDMVWVEERLETLQQRYREKPEWQEREAAILAELRERLQDQSRVKQLEALLKEIPDPSPEQLRTYYEQHPEQFTSPERIRVSLILLRVAPSASRATWEAAHEESRRLDEKLREGADFAELARLHSQDPSADEGGDLGYLHVGMLGSFAQDALDELRPGELSGPVQLLDGIGLFRLEERLPGELSELSKVEERAAGLWKREERDRVRQALVASLRANASIEIHDPEYIALAEQKAGRSPDGGGEAVAVPKGE